MINSEDIIYEYYRPGSRLAGLLLDHSRRVRDKALAVASRLSDLQPDMAFIEQAAMLHDIGILRTNAADIHCFGDQPYVCHGIIGRQLLADIGLDRLGLVCERHVGTGITMEDIRKQNLPLPLRDMTPQTLEEEIVCYADKFYSKNGSVRQYPVEIIAAQLARYGARKADIFLGWHARFNA